MVKRVSELRPERLPFIKYSPVQSLISLTVSERVTFTSLHENRSSLIKDIEQQPVATLIAFIEGTVYDEAQVDLLREVLKNPHNLSKLLKLDASEQPRKKLLKYILWLSRFHRSFVWEIVEECCRMLPQVPNDSYGHPLGFDFTCALGTILAECGWHAQAIILLKRAYGQANNRPHKLLLALRPLLLAETFCCHPIEKTQTLTKIRNILDQFRPNNDLFVTMHTTEAIHYFEKKDFKESYSVCLKGCMRMNFDTCRLETVVAAMRQLAKSCLALGRRSSATHIITQAVIYASSQPRLRAEAIEDMAHFLLILGEYQEAIEMHQQAMSIYIQEYGAWNSEPEVVRRNVVFSQFLQSKGIGYSYTPLTLSRDALVAASRRLETMQTFAKDSDPMVIKDIHRMLNYEFTAVIPLAQLKKMLSPKRV